MKSEKEIKGSIEQLEILYNMYKRQNNKSKMKELENDINLLEWVLK